MIVRQLSPLDVAVEFVATKLALRDLIWNVTGTTVEVGNLDRWAFESPVAFPVDDVAFDERLYGRSEELGIEMMEAIAGFMLAEVERLRECRNRGGGDG
jgi:hypothetical protein